MFKATIKSAANRILILVAAVPLLAACEMRAGSAATPMPSRAAANTPAPTAPMQTGPSASSSAPSSSAGPVLAAADGGRPGARIEVQELKRTGGDTLTLKFSLINDSDETYHLGGAALCDPEKNDHGTVSSVNLIEGVGKKKYFVVRDTEAHAFVVAACPASPQNHALTSGPNSPRRPQTCRKSLSSSPSYRTKV